MHPATIIILLVLVMWIPSAAAAVCLCVSRHRAAGTISVIVYIILSVPWLFYSAMFAYDAFVEEGPGTNAWEIQGLDPLGVPALLNIALFAAVTFYIIIKKIKNRKNQK